MKYKILKIFLSLMLVVASIDLFVFAIDQDLTITNTIDYAEDKSTATINLDVVPNTNIEIESITVDGRNVMIKNDLGVKAQEVVTENQTVIFNIAYSKDGEQFTQEENVIVDQIETMIQDSGPSIDESIEVSEEPNVVQPEVIVNVAKINILSLVQEKLIMNVGEVVDFDPKKFVVIDEGVDQNLIDKVVVNSNVNNMKVGSYEVEFSVVDDAGGTSSVVLKVSVQGLPYLVDDNNQFVPLDGMSDIRKREYDSTRYFEGYHIVYDQVLEDGTIQNATPIPLGYNEDSSYAVVSKVLNESNVDVGAVAYKVPGIYEAYYEFSNPYGGVSTTIREILVRGELVVADGTIEYSSTNPVKKYSNFDEFYTMNKNQIEGFVAEVLTENNVLNKYGEANSSITIQYVGLTNFSDIDFTEMNPDGTPKTLILQLTATDNSKSLGFFEMVSKLNVIVHVVNKVQNAPIITVKNPITYRLSSDSILLNGIEVESDTKLSLTDSPIYKKLLDYIEVVDDEDIANGFNTVIEVVKIKEINQDLEINFSSLTVQQDIIDLLKSPGIVEVTYRAVDQSGNASMTVKDFEIASDIWFDDFSQVINVRQKIGGYYSPHAIIKYIDSSRNEISSELVLDEISLDSVMVHRVEFVEAQRYIYFPDSTQLRPKVKMEQDILTQGMIWFSGNQPMFYFVEDVVNLDIVKAGFYLVNQQGVRSFHSTPVTNNENSATITSDSPGYIRVTFETEDTLSGVNDGTVTIDKVYGFTSLPMISSKQEITVKEYESQSNMDKMINANAAVTLPDLSVKEVPTIIDYSKVDPIQGGDAQIDASYTLINKEEKTTTKLVKVNVIKKPIITANNIELRIGDLLDILSMSDVKVTVFTGQVDLSKLVIQSNVPEENGIVNQVGNYSITFEYTDDIGNTSSYSIRVNVKSKESESSNNVPSPTINPAEPKKNPTIKPTQNPSNTEEANPTSTPSQEEEIEITVDEDSNTENKKSIEWWWIVLTIIITTIYTYYLVKKDE